ncbi:MAG TPA: glycosyltransferase family 4 protein [Mycobacteriales bacterium]|nr:glycosyltransferase family 4 protein [Mycobacteriales bacterium]
MRTPPRVVFFQANFPSTIDYPNARPVRFMQRRGLDVQIVSYGTGHESLDGVPLWREHGVVGAARRIARLRPDLLFVETPTTSLTLALAARRVWVRSPVLSPKPQKAMVQRQLMRAVDHVTFCNPADALPWDLPSSRLVDLPYPVDVEFWSARSERDPSWWSTRGLPVPTGPVLVCVANFVAVKRQAELVNWIAPLLVERGAHLVLAGRVFDTTVARDVERAVLEHGLGDRVHVVGELSHEDVRSLYAWTDVAVINSRKETQCMSLYESLAAGVVTILRDVGQLTSAFPALPRFDDAEGLHAAVARCLDERGLSQELVDAAQPRVAWADVRRHDRLLDQHLDRLLGA